MSTSAMCKICGYQVWPVDASNVLGNQSGDTNCPPPYYVVRNERTNAAVTSFFREHNDKTAKARALEYASRDPDWTVVEISPHGHQISK